MTQLTIIPLALVEAGFRRMPPFVGARLMNRGLRLAGVKVGKTTCFWGLPTFQGDPRTHLTIGEHCGLNAGCFFDLAAPVTLSDHVSVGHEVMFLTQLATRVELSDETFLSPPLGISVGTGAWIGARATILPGVTIGPGAVVSAGTIVNSDVPPHTLLSGSRKISLAKWR